MSLQLRMIYLGQDTGPGEFPPINQSTVSVDGFPEASKVCLDQIRLAGLVRDQWIGGILTDDNGKEVAQVSYNGIVWEERPRALQRYYSVYAPPSTGSEYSYKIPKLESLRLEIPGCGAVSFAKDQNCDSATRMLLTAEPGFLIDGQLAEYYEAKFEVRAEGVVMTSDSGFFKVVGDSEDDASEALLNITKEGIEEWLRDLENAASFTALVERHAVAFIDLPREQLGDSDHHFEEERRNLLARVLEVAAFREGMEALKPSGPRP